jgi:ABC-type lipoprotein release transport system permease subunit
MQLLRIVATLAWRNLWRNHRRTLVMLAAITVGVWAMIFMTAMMRGMVNQMLRDGIRNLPGEIQIHNPAFLDDPGVNSLISESFADIAARLDSAGLPGWAGRVKVPAVISSEQESRGVSLVGMDPLAERDISFLASSISAGRNLGSAADPGLVIGQKLADVLETGIGKRVVIMSQDPQNEIADRGFRIIGLFHTTLEAQEEAAIFAGRDVIGKMLGIDDHVNEIVVRGDDYRRIQPLLRKVRALAGRSLDVQPWNTLEPYLGSMLSVMDGFVLVWMIVVFLALSFGLVNTLVMAVFERVREIGLMLALGMKPAAILGQIMVESVLLLVLGLIAGNLLALATIIPLAGGIDISAVAQGMEMFGAASTLYPELSGSDVLLANTVVVVLGVLASVSPAWRASRYEPIEAISKGGV